MCALSLTCWYNISSRMLRVYLISMLALVCLLLYTFLGPAESSNRL